MSRSIIPRSIMVPLPPTQPNDSLETLVGHCLAAHAIIGEHGSSVMQRLIDLLLYEVGRAMAADDGDHAAELDAPGVA